MRHKLNSKTRLHMRSRFSYTIVKGLRIMKKIIAIANKTTDHCEYTKNVDKTMYILYI